MGVLSTPLPPAAAAATPTAPGTAEQIENDISHLWKMVEGMDEQSDDAVRSMRSIVRVARINELHRENEELQDDLLFLAEATAASPPRLAAA
jgi:hypothetical protein